MKYGKNVLQELQSYKPFLFINLKENQMYILNVMIHLPDVYMKGTTESGEW